MGEHKIATRHPALQASVSQLENIFKPATRGTAGKTLLCALGQQNAIRRCQVSFCFWYPGDHGSNLAMLKDDGVSQTMYGE